MGYSGPPSKACLPCRQRRIKCDRATPACSQCLRVGKACGGYRIEADFLFRDQTRAVAGKVKGVSHETKSGTKTSSNHTPPKHVVSLRTRTIPDVDCFNLSSYQSRCPISFSPQVPADDQAACFFFTKYRNRRPSGERQSLYEYLPDLYTFDDENHPLRYIISAIGLGGLSHQRNDPKLLIAADAAYNLALRRTNHALRHPMMASSDHTLISVLLLGLYETDICQESRSTMCWLKHVQGASVLLELRGKEQLGTQLGRRLFKDLRTQILLRCSLRRSPTPQALIELSRECQKYGQSAADDLVLITIDLLALRAERPFRPHAMDSDFVDRDIVCRCTFLAIKLETWRLRQGSDLSPVSMTAETPRPDVLGNHYDVYRDAWTAGLLNRYRVLSLLIHELAVTRLLSLQRRNSMSGNEVFQIQARRHEIFAHVNAICASVPFLLESGSIEAVRSLVWPLYVSAQINPREAPLTRTTRDWIVKRLTEIGFEMGVRQAIFLADLLNSQQEVTNLVSENQGSFQKEYD